MHDTQELMNVEAAYDGKNIQTGATQALKCKIEGVIAMEMRKRAVAQNALQRRVRFAVCGETA